MSYAYTPGLKVMKNTIVRKSRILPVPGEVLVREGDSILGETIVARTYVPGEVIMMPMFYLLGVEPEELPGVMLKKEGDFVKKDEVIAISKWMFGLFRNECKANTTGTIELISDATGQIAIREPPVPLNMTAYISGRVVEVIPNFEAVIETPAAFVQGIFGIGGERQGELMTIAAPDEALTTDHIDKGCARKILVGGSLVTSEVLKKAADEGVKGIVTGGMLRKDLDRFLGYDIGVAITGHEDINLTCVITEGFGKMTMAKRTFDMLNSLEGKQASINGATQIRAGVIRPEVIVPIKDGNEPISEEESLTSGMGLGTRIRIIRQPYFGAIGHITDLPTELQTLESESRVRVVCVKLDNGQQVTIPRANVEIIEE